MLAQQLRTYEATFVDLSDRTMVMVGEKQREANRNFTPVVEKAMQPAYVWCKEETGMCLSLFLSSSLWI